MQNTDFSQIVPFPEISHSDLTRQLSEENLRLHQIIDEITNRLAIQQELIQQLKPEFDTCERFLATFLSVAVLEKRKSVVSHN